MSKFPMYFIITVTMGIGSYLPVLFGADMLDPLSILGGFVGGVIGVFVYARLRKAGYIE